MTEASESSGTAVVEAESLYYNAHQGNLIQMRSLEVTCYASPSEVVGLAKLLIRVKPRDNPRDKW